FPPWF
uniref:Tryptophyllin-T2-1 n=1 Tax=Pithecopus azureus TaxID=2034991 RepID=TY21_PITAZ